MSEKTYSVEEAIKLIKENSKEKFDASIEAHFKFGLDVTKPEQMIRTTVSLPHGVGKETKVAVFANAEVSSADLQLTEENLQEIQQGKLKPGVDFDILVTEPALMSTLARLGKILGPAGAMPNPKTGTVTTDVEKAVEEIKKGRMEIRTEQKAPVLHTIIGKVSFDEEKLVDNDKSLLKSLRSLRPQKVNPEAYIKSIHLCSSMGKSYEVSAALIPVQK